MRLFERLIRLRPARAAVVWPALLASLGAQDDVKLDTNRAARTIDQLVAGALEQVQQAPNPIVDDATFGRRAYLTIIGRIPTLAEARAFLADRSADKRGRLVDALLESPGRTSHETNWWADLLRARSRLMRQVSGEPFLDWIEHAVAANQPYDQMVRAMLTASGSALERGNGATGYLLRDLEMPLDSMANTVRLFLGTRLECAQCHNHPFDRWTQLQFYQLAAFTGGLRYRTDFEQSPVGEQLAAAARSAAEEHGQQARQALRRLQQQFGAGLSGSGTGLLRLPDKYAYDDAKAGQVVAATTIFGDGVKLDVKVPAEARRSRTPRPGRAQAAAVGPEIEARAAFAAWLTAADNPRFALVFANRMWQRIMGRGLVEPIDDLRDDTRAVNPELLAYLEQLAVDLDFDVKEFQRVLLRTQLFQRAVPAAEVAADQEYRFPGPLLRRMTAEQYWDSLVTLAVDDPDAGVVGVNPRAEEVYRRFETFLTASSEQLAEEIDRLVLRLTDPEQAREAERARRAEMLRERGTEQANKQREARPLLRALAAAQAAGDQAKVAELEAELQAKGVTIPGRARRRGAIELARASELPQPARGNHPLRLFGQSDRETSGAGNAEANVPQVLTLLNGIADDGILASGKSALRAAVQAAKTPAAQIEAAFIAVLGRRPTAAELADWTRAWQQGAATATGDLLWVLLNSHEFRFIR